MKNLLVECLGRFRMNQSTEIYTNDQTNKKNGVVMLVRASVQ